MKKFNFEDICWPLKLCLCDFAEQSLHCSIILRGKERSLRDFAGQRTKALWFRGAKSALLHNFAGQSLHCSITLRGKDMDFRPKIEQLMRFSYFLKKYFDKWQLFQWSIAPWWPLLKKNINCRTVPLINIYQALWGEIWTVFNTGSLYSLLTSLITPHWTYPPPSPPPSSQCPLIFVVSLLNFMGRG